MIDETKKIFNDILPSVEKTRDKTERLIEAVCIGGGLVTGFLALGYPGLITSGIISTLGSRYVAKPLSKKLVTFGTSNSLISIFDFKEDVKHWMGQRKV